MSLVQCPTMTPGHEKDDDYCARIVPNQSQNLKGNRISKREIQAERAAVYGVYCQSEKFNINIFFK